MNILKQVELFVNMNYFLQTLDTYVNFAYDELCCCAWGKELVCKFFHHILYIFNVIRLLGRRACS